MILIKFVEQVSLIYLGHWVFNLKVLGSIPTEDDPHTTNNFNRQ